MAKKVTIEFSNEDAAHHFASWLCGSGEQQYWEWMRCREEDEDGPITALSFDYHKANGGKFGTKILTECGRLTETDGD